MTAQDSILHSLDTHAKHSLVIPVILVLVAAVVLGTLTGYLLAPKKQISSVPAGSASKTASGTTFVKGQIIGSPDTAGFKDSTEGVLKTGGIADEGQYHLVRPGGDSQNVYLTSSTVDLSQFVDKKIKVWGATQTAKHAGWLMDVGRVEILE